MKSIKGQGDICCPNCSEHFEAEFWTLIRGDEDAELKDALMGGEINLSSCPSCGHFFYHDRTIIYFDPPSELLALVSPAGGKEGFEKVKEQMKKDFELIKKTLTSVTFDYEPFYLQSLEELKALLEYEDRAVLESEVIAAHSAQSGYKIARLKPSVARGEQYSYYIPVAGDTYDKESVLKPAKELSSKFPDLRLLKNFEQAMSKGKKLPPKI